MKRILFVLLIFSPLFVCSQHSHPGSGLTEYLWTTVGTEGFSPGAALYVDMKMSPGDVPYVAFIDAFYDNKVAVWTYNGTFWDYVGNVTVSPGSAYYASLDIGGDGEMYVAFQDQAQSYKASVMKFNGTEWTYLGMPGFSAGNAHDVKLALSPAGVPFVVYRDMANSNKASVMKFDNGQWVQVGSPGFSSGTAWYPQIAVDPSGTPYVAFRDGAHSEKASVMRFVSGSWTHVGVPGFTAGSTEGYSLAIGPDGQPWFSYPDPAFSHKATVLRYNGEFWLPQGTAGFTAMGITDSDLAFSPAGEACLAVNEWIPIYTGYRGHVVKFNGTGWEAVGNPSISVNRMFDPSLDFTAAGQPYLGYSDYGINNEAVVKRCDSISVGVPEKPGRSGIRLWPNPATDRITVECKTTSQTAAVYELSDARGILRAKGVASDRRVMLDLSGYPSGVYFVRIIAQKVIRVERFCKM